MKRIRMIGTDLDGTLLTDQKELTSNTKEVIEEAIRQGILFLPTTGRAKSGIPDYLTSIQGLRYVILSNGAAVIDLEEDRYIYRNCFTAEEALTLLGQLREYGTFVDFFSEGAGRCQRDVLENLDRYRIEKPVQNLIRMSRVPIDNLEEWLMETGNPVDKFTLFFADLEYRLKVYEELKARTDITVSSSVRNNIEINTATCNKGTALMGLGDYLGISRDQIMAVGDGDNDLSMIRMAGLGVAMANAPEHIRKEADYVTKSNEEEGVAFAIEKFALRKA